MAWPTTAKVAPVLGPIVVTFGKRAVADSDVPYDSGYATGYSDGFTAGGGSTPTTGQLWPRREG